MTISRTLGSFCPRALRALLPRGATLSVRRVIALPSASELYV